MTEEKILQNQISLTGVIERHFEEIRSLYTQKVKKKAIWEHFKNLYDLNTQSGFWQTYYRICRKNGLEPRYTIKLTATPRPATIVSEHHTVAEKPDIRKPSPSRENSPEPRKTLNSSEVKKLMEETSKTDFTRYSRKDY